MKRSRLQFPIHHDIPWHIVSLDQVKCFAKGILIILGFVNLFLCPRSAAASRGIFQENTQTSTLEIRYHNPAAGQVALVWGVNEWQTLPEEERPAGTELRNGNMFTPMLVEGESFIIRLQLPAMTTVNFGFLTTHDQNGNPVEIWEANGDDDFRTITAETYSVVDIQSVLPPEESFVSGEIPGGQKVVLDINYSSTSSGEVSLIWGVNGWSLVPEEERPVGTVVEKNVMRTPMLKEEGIFVTSLQVAPGSVVDFGFLTTKDRQGKAVEVWEANGADDYHLTVNQDTVQKVQSQLALKANRDLPSTLVVGIYIVIGLLVVLIVGFVFRRQSV